MVHFLDPRVRVRSDEKVGRMRYLWEGNAFSSEGGFNGWQTFTRVEEIHDKVGTPRTQRIKPALHRTLEYRGLPYQIWHGDWNYEVRPLAGVGPYLRASDFWDSVPLPPDSVRQAASGRAFTFFSERFPQQISFAEFAGGFLELQQMLPQFQKSLMRTLAGLYLNEKFAWESLLRDLEALSGLLGTVRIRLEWLKATRGKPTKLFYYERGVWSPPSGQIGTVWYEPVRGWGVRVTPKSYSCDFRAGASLLQRLDHLDDAIGWFRAIIFSLGLNRPLKSVWEVLPMSFVVDWFAGVSDHLDRLGSIQPAEEWSVYNVSSSVTAQVKWEVTQVNGNLWGSSSPQEMPLGELSYRCYARYVGLPVDLGIYTPSTLTPAQLVLLTAMVATKS